MSMKQFIILLMLLCFFGGAVPVIAEDGKVQVVRVGISPNTLGNVNRNDFFAAFKSWMSLVGKEKNLLLDTDVKEVVGEQNLRDAILQKKLDAFVITVEDSMALKIQPEFIFMPRRGKGVHVNYAVVIRSISGITDITGLKDIKIVTYDSGEMILGRTWLKVLLAGRGKGLYDINVTDNAGKCILQVFFKQSDAALVTQDAFDLACELNPQLKKDLTILAVSPPIVPNFFMFAPTFQGEFRETIEKALIDVHTTPGGKQVLSIFQSSRMEKHPASILEQSRKLLTEYQGLVNEGLQP